MRSAVEDLKALCVEITQFASESGRFSTEAINLNDLVAGAIVSSHVQEHPKIRCQIRFAEPAPAIQGNGPQLKQCMLLILGNAIDAMPGGGELLIETRSGNPVEVMFQDSGPGMDLLTRARCTNAFYSTKKSKGNTGMGLFIANGITRRNGGTLVVESEPEQGAVVTLQFPREERT